MWYLIIILMTPTGIAVDHVMFSSQNACLQGQAQLKATAENSELVCMSADVGKPQTLSLKESGLEIQPGSVCDQVPFNPAWSAWCPPKNEQNGGSHAR